jgi:hypothetical protein
MQKSQYSVTTEFSHKNSQYIAWVHPYFLLSPEEISFYKIIKYDFVAHLFSLEGFKTFEIYQDESLEWKTNASPLLIDHEIVEIIGQIIAENFA